MSAPSGSGSRPTDEASISVESSPKASIPSAAIHTARKAGPCANAAAAKRPLMSGRGTTECPHCGVCTPHHHTSEWIKANSFTLAVERLEAIQMALAANGCGQLYPSMARVYGLDGNQGFEMERRLERDLCAALYEIGWRRAEERSE